MQTAIDFLKALSGIRTPFLDVLFQFVTRFGEEIIIFGAICALFWCIDKDYAYRLGFTFFGSSLLTQGLKITFCVNRPFVLDPTLEPVQSAIGNATGYSFPSGHTQSATALYGTVFASTGKKALKACSAVLILLVGFSRLYLGVHTYFDVLAAFAVTAACVYVFRHFFDKTRSEKTDVIVSGAVLLLSLSLCLYAYLSATYGKTDPAQINDCFKTGGSGAAFAVCYFIERKYIRFSVKAPNIYVQIIKALIGAGVALALKSVPKLLFPTSLLLDFLRYFLTISWVVAIYPLIFDRIINKNTKYCTSQKEQSDELG